MKDPRIINWRDAKIAVLYALSFVLLVVVYRLWENEQVTNAWKLIAVGTTGAYLLWVFDRSELITFAGFCMLMTGLNFIWSEKSIQLVWKITASIVVVAQFYTLGDKATPVGTNK